MISAIERIANNRKRSADYRSRNRAKENVRVFDAVKVWIKANPLKRKAHKVVYVEKRAGRLRNGVCFCGSRKTEAHHDDYSKPLEITWLCKKHHGLADSGKLLEIIKSIGLV